MLRGIVCTFSMYLLVFLIGCSSGASDNPDLGTVEGTVTIDGKKMKNVFVSFAPDGDGRPSNGVTDEDGAYRLVYSTTEMGAKVGAHTVKISSYNDADPNDMDAQMATTEVVPEKYLDVEKTVEVTAGSNTIDLTYP